MNFTNCTSVNESVEEYLGHLQAKANLTIIPAVIMMSILAIVGLIGNILVLIVYSKKFTLSPTKVLIMTIASFDLIANVGAIPTDVYYVFNSWNFRNAALCKAKVFLATFSTVGAAISLVVVAIVRYRKICRPHAWQVTTKQAQVISCATAVASLLLCIPYIIIANIGTRKTACLNIKGHGCYINDYYLRTLWPVINQIMLIVLHLFSSFLLVVLYVLVGVTAWRLSRKLILVGNGSKSKNKAKSTNKSSVEDAESKRLQGQIQPPGLNRQESLVDVQKSAPICASLGKAKTALCSVKPGKILTSVYGSQASTSVNTSSSTNDTGTTENSRGTHSETISLQVTSSEEMSQSAENVHANRSLKNTQDSTDDDEYEQNKQVALNSSNCENRNIRKNQENHKHIREITTKRKPKSNSLDINGKATRKKLLSRMTAMLIIISLIYVLSYIPFFVIAIISYRQPAVMAKLNTVEVSVTKVFVRLYFVNSAANPIIYSLCCVKFRQACIRLFTFTPRRWL